MASTREWATIRADQASYAVTIEIREEAIGCRNQVLVLGKVVRTQGDPAQKLVEDFCSILGWKRVKLVEQLLGTLSHESRLAFNVF